MIINGQTEVELHDMLTEDFKKGKKNQFLEEINGDDKRAKNELIDE